MSPDPFSGNGAALRNGSTRTAAITGIGLVTPVGSSMPEVLDAMYTGRSGLMKPPQNHPLASVTQVAGIGPDIDPAPLLPPTMARVVDRYVILALRAAADALTDAGLQVGRDVDPYRIGVIVSGVGGLAMFETNAVARTRRGRFGVSPHLLAGMLPGMGAAHIAIRHGIRGYTSSVATACAAGAQSIGEGLRLIRAGDADVVVCGSSEALLFPAFADAFGNARALAHGWPAAAQASRPFDRRRNGFVLSEGAGVLILERPEHAEARGAAGYADIVGWGATTDAFHPTSPRPDGTAAAACMRQALADAARSVPGVTESAIGYINAHGTGTKRGDAAEAQAIRAAFGDGPPVSSTKGLTGHMLGASGAVEAAITMGAMLRGLLPPTFNLDDPDPACDLDHIRERPRRAGAAHAMSNSFGFGGHNISLVLGPASTRGTRSV